MDADVEPAYAASIIYCKCKTTRMTDQLTPRITIAIRSG